MTRLRLAVASVSPDFRFTGRGRDFTPGQAVLDHRPLADIDSRVDALDTMRRDTALVEIVWRGRTQELDDRRLEPTREGA